MRADEDGVDPGLVLVATPIGNMGDMAPRAVAELEHASRIACEDTRRTGSLLKHFGVGHEPFIVCNEHTEMTAASQVVDLIAAGGRVVLVSDAGMPGISDPGYRMVCAVIEAGQPVTAVPGASAVLMALAVSGLAADRFCFEGFLPRKGRDRTARVRALKTEDRSTVLFESPRRVERTVIELHEVLEPTRQIVLARELTKTYEEIWRGNLAEAIEYLAEAEPRGEFVLIVAGAEPVEVEDDHIRVYLRDELAAGASKRDAVSVVVDRLGVAKRRVYDLAVEL